jgi:hypothetical protein
VSIHQFIECGCTVETAPVSRPDGQFIAHALVTRHIDHQVEELWPGFEPFQTEAEASSASHLAAAAWVRRQDVQR